MNVDRVADAAGTVRTMLSARLKIEVQALADDFRWIDAMGIDDAEYFLMEINDVFVKIPTGLSFGTGQQPFTGIIGAALFDQLSTVGGLISHVKRHVSAAHR